MIQHHFFSPIPQTLQSFHRFSLPKEYLSFLKENGAGYLKKTKIMLFVMEFADLLLVPISQVFYVKSGRIQKPVFLNILLYFSKMAPFIIASIINRVLKRNPVFDLLTPKWING